MGLVEDDSHRRRGGAGRPLLRQVTVRHELDVVVARCDSMEADLVADLVPQLDLVSLATRAATLVAAMRRGCVTRCAPRARAPWRGRSWELRGLCARDDDHRGGWWRSPARTWSRQLFGAVIPRRAGGDARSFGPCSAEGHGRGGRGSRSEAEGPTCSGPEVDPRVPA